MINQIITAWYGSILKTKYLMKTKISNSGIMESRVLVDESGTFLLRPEPSSSRSLESDIWASLASFEKTKKEQTQLEEFLAMPILQFQNNFAFSQQKTCSRYGLLLSITFSYLGFIILSTTSIGFYQSMKSFAYTYSNKPQKQITQIYIAMQQQTLLL